MKAIRETIVVLFVIAGLVWCATQWASKNIEHQAKAAQAYAKMYEDLKNKSPDHRSIVSMYEVCRVQERRPKTPEPVTSHVCIQKMQGWASKMTMKVPFENIRQDIEAAEALTFLDLESKS